MDLETWKPKRQNNWGKPLEIAGIRFDNPSTYTEKINIKKN